MYIILLKTPALLRLNKKYVRFAVYLKQETFVSRREVSEAFDMRRVPALAPIEKYTLWYVSCQIRWRGFNPRYNTRTVTANAVPNLSRVKYLKLNYIFCLTHSQQSSYFFLFNQTINGKIYSRTRSYVPHKYFYKCFCVGVMFENQNSNFFKLYSLSFYVVTYDSSHSMISGLLKLYHKYIGLATNLF